MSNSFFKAVNAQSVTLSVASQQVTMADPRTLYLRLASGATPFFYATGVNPTATTSSALMPINWIDYIQISPGEKIAILGSAAANTASIVELSS